MKRSRLARYHEKNPTTDTYVVAGIGLALAAGLGYWLYSQSQLNAATSSGSASSAGDASSGTTSQQGTFVNAGSSGYIGTQVASSEGINIGNVGDPNLSIPFLPTRG